jgi:hypothetical protein
MINKTIFSEMLIYFHVNYNNWSQILTFHFKIYLCLLEIFFLNQA